MSKTDWKYGDILEKQPGERLVFIAYEPDGTRGSDYKRTFVAVVLEYNGGFPFGDADGFWAFDEDHPSFQWLGKWEKVE
jgi:hypothetical protein